MRPRDITSVLAVDDCAELLRSAKRALASRRIALARRADEAVDIIRRERVDVAVVDVYLSDSGGGFAVVRELRQLQPDALAVMMSGMFCAANTRAAFHAGAHDCVEKPFEWPELMRRLENGMPLGREPRELPSLYDVEVNYYASVVDAHGGNISAAARMLRMRRTSLQRILARHRETRGTVPSESRSPRVGRADLIATGRGVDP